jgi:hypothetical protein
MPTPPLDCTGAPGCSPTQNAPVDPAVYAALDDAQQRLVPNLDDAAARAELGGALQALEVELHANRLSEARTRLALAYVQLDKMRISLPGTDLVDLPDMSAVRLALVPVANALGVRLTA